MNQMTKKGSVSRGDRFGRLVALRAAASSSSGHKQFIWKCDCGELKCIRIEHVVSGRTNSCGCLHDQAAGDRNRTHGLAKTRVYGIWSGMIQRCTNPKVKIYPYYGGRGIKVCDRWRNSFECFLADMGHPPSENHSIDRFPNKDGDYGPGNCRWATDQEQALNMRSNALLTVNGETLRLIEWCDRAGVTQPAIYYRVKKGETRLQAIIHFLKGKKYERVGI